MDLATRLPRFAKILVLPQFCFSPAHSDLALTKAQRPALGARGRGRHYPLHRGETEARRNKQSGRAAGRGDHKEPPPGPPVLGLSQPWAIPPSPALGAGGDAAVPTHWVRFWGRTDSPAACVIPGHPAFFNQLFQGSLPASLCWGCGRGQPVAVLPLPVASEPARREHRCTQVPDVKGHQGPRCPYGAGGGDVPTAQTVLEAVIWSRTGEREAFHPVP